MKQHIFFNGGAGINPVIPFHLKLHLVRPGIKNRFAVFCPVHLDFHDGLVGHFVVDAEHCQNIILQHGVLHLRFVREFHSGVIYDDRKAVGAVWQKLRRYFIYFGIVLHGTGNGKNKRIEHECGEQQRDDHRTDFQPSF